MPTTALVATMMVVAAAVRAVAVMGNDDETARNDADDENEGTNLLRHKNGCDVIFTLQSPPPFASSFFERLVGLIVFTAAGYLPMP